MSEDIKANVDTNSAEFKQGVEARLNSAEGTKNWRADKNLNQELKDEDQKKDRLYKEFMKETSSPVFLRDSPEGNKGNDQDEKDEMEE